MASSDNSKRKSAGDEKFSAAGTADGGWSKRGKNESGQTVRFQATLSHFGIYDNACTKQARGFIDLGIAGDPSADMRADVFVQYAAVAMPFANPDIYDASDSCCPTKSAAHSETVTAFNLLHGMYSDVRDLLTKSEFMSLSVGNYHHCKHVEPSMRIDVPLQVRRGEVTTGCLAVLRYVSSRTLRESVWACSFEERLREEHFAQIRWDFCLSR